MHLFAARLAVLACALLIAWNAPVMAAPVAPDAEAKKSETPAEKIKKALDQTTDLEISDQPLHLALAQLREQTKVNFVVDRQTIAAMGVDPEQMPVNVKFSNVKLRNGLRSILGQYNLSYAIVGDAVIVTTEDMAMIRQLRQRVNLDLNRVQFADAVKQLARETGTNLVLDPRSHKESQAPVTLQLEDVPLEMAVRLMAEMAGLKPVRMGNVLFVTSKASAAELRQDQDLFPNPQQAALEQLLVPGVGVIGGIGGVGRAIGGIPVQPVPALPVPPPPPEEKPAKPEEKPPEKENR